MNNTVCIPTHTFEELVEELQEFVKLLDLKIREEEKNKSSITFSMYDPKYIHELLDRKIRVLTKIEQMLKEAILANR